MRAERSAWRWASVRRSATWRSRPGFSGSGGGARRPARYRLNNSTARAMTRVPRKRPATPDADAGPEDGVEADALVPDRVGPEVDAGAGQEDDEGDQDDADHEPHAAQDRPAGSGVRRRHRGRPRAASRAGREAGRRPRSPWSRVRERRRIGVGSPEPAAGPSVGRVAGGHDRAGASSGASPGASCLPGPSPSSAGASGSAGSRGGVRPSASARRRSSSRMNSSNRSPMATSLGESGPSGARRVGRRRPSGPVERLHGAAEALPGPARRAGSGASWWPGPAPSGTRRGSPAGSATAGRRPRAGRAAPGGSPGGRPPRGSAPTATLRTTGPAGAAAAPAADPVGRADLAEAHDPVVVGHPEHGKPPVVGTVHRLGHANVETAIADADLLLAQEGGAWVRQTFGHRTRGYRAGGQPRLFGSGVVSPAPGVSSAGQPAAGSVVGCGRRRARVGFGPRRARFGGGGRAGSGAASATPPDASGAASPSITGASSPSSDTWIPSRASSSDLSATVSAT